MQPLLILFGACFTLAISFALGARLLGEACLDPGIRLVSGAAVLNAAVFACCAAGLAYPGWFLVLGATSLWIGYPRSPNRLVPFQRFAPDSRQVARQIARPNRWAQHVGTALAALRKVPPLRRWWLLAAPYVVLYLAKAMAPEISFDGSRYHLGLVARYLREHGFHPIHDNFYAALSQGVEMLYLFAFSFGRHSAAAVVHFGLLLALVWQMYSWSCRAGFPLAGICGALLVFASPMVGVDGTSAYNDVAAAAIAFTLFHLLQIWDERRSTRLLVAIGLVAGFAYAAKYTACLAIPYAVAFVAWRGALGGRRWRNAAIVAGCAAAMVLPWMFKDWLCYHNPLAPFFNQWFPNPYVTVSFEREYRQQLASYNLPSRWQIPMQVTSFGSLSGLLGPVFLLAPLGLLSLRVREGRHLLAAAAVFGATFFSNVSTRFLIPALPFLALALCLVLARAPRIAIGVVALHLLLSWPPVVRRYCHADAWRLVKVTYREALRIKPEDGFLESNLPLYGAARLVERATPPGSTIFTQTPIPEAYTSRHIQTAYQSASNIASRDVLWSGFVPEHAPTRRLRFAFPRRRLRGIRIVQTNTANGAWSIHEIRAFDGGRELPRAGWRGTANPYPWGVENLWDNRLASFWRCGDTLHAGQFVQVNFGAAAAVDTVLLETAPDQPGVRLKLEGIDAQTGDRQAAADAPEISDGPLPADMRRQAAEELRRRGIDYLLAMDGEFGASDLRDHSAEWGIRQIGEYKGARLYQLP